MIPAIQSRCLLVRIPAPTEEEIITVLQNIAKKENCQLPLELAEKIAEKSNRNLRRAILLTEACRVAQYPFTAGEFLHLLYRVFVEIFKSWVPSKKQLVKMYLELP